MILETLGALSLGLNFDAGFATTVALSLVGILTVLSKSSSDDKEEIKERLTSAVRSFTELVSHITTLRAAKNIDIAAESKVDEQPDGSDEEPALNSSGESGGPDFEISGTQDSKETESEKKGLHSNDPSINYADFWREDYWNFEEGSEGGIFASDEDEDSESWDSSEDDENRVDPRDTQWNDREESDDELQETSSTAGRSSNFYGPFFRNRNYPGPADVDAPTEDDSPDAPRRWRRKKVDKDEEPHDSEAGWDSTLSDDDLDKLFYGTADDDNDEEQVDSEFSADDDFESDFDYLDDESVSEEEKLDYLRKRVEEGGTEARDELVRMLLQRVAVADADERQTALDALDEAESLLKESRSEDGEPFYDDNNDELLAQTLLQRPAFYLRNHLTPPMDDANNALNHIRQWADANPNPEARRLLATAWQMHGNCLLASGSDSAALSSLLESRTLFVELVDSGVEEATPSLGFVSVLIAETYMSIGDERKAVEAYREALDTFKRYADQEIFLAEKAKVMYRLSKALRQLGSDEEADRTIEEAIEVEERLLSYDEEAYFGPLTQLLEAKADIFAQRGKYEDALALLDRAVATLEQFLTYDSLMPHRVMAYAHMENTLRRRAAIYMWQKRYLLAARDLEKAVDYLALATKKGDDFDPVVQATIVNSLLYDLCACQDVRQELPALQDGLNSLFASLTPEEYKHITPIYAQLLLKRHNVLAREGFFSESYDAANEAIELLNKLVSEEDFDAEHQTILAKAYALRGAYRAKSARQGGLTLSDIRRAKELLVQGLDNGELDEPSKKFFIELLAEKASVEIKEGIMEEAYDDLKVGVRVALSSRSRKRWEYLDELAVLSRSSILLVSKLENVARGLRAASLWLRFAERLRRSYVDSEWSFDEEGNENPRNREFLKKFEAFITDVRLVRAELLEDAEWEPDFEKYCDVEPALMSVPEQKSESLDVGNGELSSIGAELVHFCRLSDRRYYAEERNRVVQNKFSDDVKLLAIFCDLDFCLRVVRRRIFEGDLGLGQTLSRLVGKIVENFLVMDESALAAAEIDETARVFDNLFDQMKERPVGFYDDAHYWLAAFPIWDLQADLLGRLYTDYAERVSVETAENEAEEELRQTCLEKMKAQTDRAFLHMLIAVKRLPVADPTLLLRTASSYATYYIWLSRNGRQEEACQLVRKEGERLENRAQMKTPLNLLAVSLFYELISNAALDACYHPETAKWALHKLEDALNAEKKIMTKQVVTTDRFGRLYSRFADLADAEGQTQAALEWARKALECFTSLVRNNTATSRAFGLFTKLVVYLFDKGTDEDKRLGAKLYRVAERYFNSSSKKRRRERVSNFWIISISAFRWYDLDRNCFSRAKYIVENFERLCEYFPDELTRVYKQIEGSFYRGNFLLRHCSFEGANDALTTLVDLLKGRLEDFGAIPNDDPMQSIMLRLHEQLKSQLIVSKLLKVELGVIRDDEAPDVRDTLRNALALCDSAMELQFLFKPKTPFFQRVQQFRKNWIEEKKERETDEREMKSSPVDDKERVSIKRRLVAWKGRLKDYVKSAEAIWERNVPKEDLGLIYSYFLLRVFDAIFKSRDESYATGRKAFNGVMAKMSETFGRGSEIEVTCRYFWADEHLNQRRWSAVVNETKRIHRMYASTAERKGYDVDVLTPLWIDSFRMTARAYLGRRRLGDLRKAEKIVDRTLNTCRQSLRQKKFHLRSVYYDLLLLQARVDYSRGRKSEALRTAERVKRAFGASAKRGAFDPSKESIKDLNALLASLKDESVGEKDASRAPGN